MTDCRYILNYYANIGVKDQSEFQKEVRSKVDDYINAKHKATIWFNMVLIEDLNKVMGIFRKFSHEIFISAGKKPNIKIEDWKKIDNLYQDATIKLKRYAGIKVFEDYMDYISK